MAKGVCCAKSTSGFNRNGSSYGPCATSYYCKKNGKCYWDTNVRDIAAISNGVIPKLVYSSVINRSKKNLLKTIQSNKPQIYFWTYNFYQALKFAYNLCGRNKTGCCYKMLWRPENSKYRILKFGDKVDLFRYLIRTPNSNLNWFIKTVLKSLQTMNLAKHMIANSKYYPYQNLVNTKSINKKCCNKFNRLNLDGYNNIRKVTQNEYIYWLKKQNIFTPYLKYDLTKMYEPKN